MDLPTPRHPGGPSIIKAMIAVQQDMNGAVLKNAVSSHIRNTYADLGQITTTLSPVCAKHGIVFTQHLSNAQGGTYVETVARHISGETLSSGEVFIPVPKQDAHGHGSAITYGRRYTLMALFGLAGVDDDGAAAVKASSNARDAQARIKPEQLRQLQQLIKTAKSDANKVCSHYKVKHLSDLDEAAFYDASALLESKIDEVAA